MHFDVCLYFDVCSVINIFSSLQKTTFDGYTTFDSYILLLAAIYHIRWLYITFDGYILLSALRYCKFAGIQVYLAIPFLCRLNTRLDFNINLLAVFCKARVSPVNFNLPF